MTESPLTRSRIHTGQFIPPRYTTDERVGLTTETGSLIYNTTTSKMQCYNGTSWIDLNS